MTKDEFFRKAGEKLDDAKRSVVNGVKDTARWMAANPLLSVALLSVGTRAVSGVYNAVQQAKKDAEKEEARLKEWDPLKMCWVKKTRELEAWERLRVDREKGERPLSEIFYELGVLDDE